MGIHAHAVQSVKNVPNGYQRQDLNRDTGNLRYESRWISGRLITPELRRSTRFQVLTHHTNAFKITVFIETIKMFACSLIWCTWPVLNLQRWCFMLLGAVRRLMCVSVDSAALPFWDVRSANMSFRLDSWSVHCIHACFISPLMLRSCRVARVTRDS